MGKQRISYKIGSRSFEGRVDQDGDRMLVDRDGTSDVFTISQAGNQAEPVTPPITPPITPPVTPPVDPPPVDTGALFAAPNGNDGTAGTIGDPFLTAGKLAASLQPGQTGYLRAGTYNEDLEFPHGGSSQAGPIVLMSYPGEWATVHGRMYVPQGSDFVTVKGIGINGQTNEGLPSPTINANDVSFIGCDVYNGHTDIAFNAGNPQWGRADRLLIQGCRIHQVGVLPPANHDHGIYIIASSDFQVLDNVIFDCADRGVQLYGDCNGIIKGNVIAYNGEGIIFSGVGGGLAHNVTVSGNVLAFAQVRYNIESYWTGAPGAANTASGNVIFAGAEGLIGPQQGFTASANTFADPLFADPTNGDFSLKPGSPALALGLVAPLTAGSLT